MKRTNIIMLMFGILLVLSLVLVSAHEHNIGGVKELIDSGISCDKLTNEQLETIGDYYMEQMHPGEQHEYMDQMMGGEGSESLKQMHINMAKSIYCNEDVEMMSGGMMNMMMGNNMMASGNGMMSGGMMGNMIMNSNMEDGIMGNNMMSNYGSYNLGFVIIYWITYILIIILIVSTIYWLIKSANGKR